MPRIRALLVGLVACAAGIAVVPASAVPLPRPVSDHVISTDHFLVHYYTAPGGAYTSEAQAGDIAAYAERAYALFRSWGYAAPVDDGDGHIDIYLTPPPGGLLGDAEPDGTAPYPSPDSGAIKIETPDELAGAAVLEGLSTADEEMKMVAHEIFHLFQFATWVPNKQSDFWLLEASAQWAGFNAIGAPSGSAVQEVGPGDVALDCRDDLPGGQMCDVDPYVEGGYSRWAFFQLLANRFGNSFVSTALVNGAGGQSAINALSTAIGSKGGTLGDVFTDYANNLMTGNFGVQALSKVRPDPEANVSTGTTSATLAPIKVPVNHLSVRYLTFTRGDGTGAAACYAATLKITVSIPSGTGSRPFFFWDVPGGGAKPLDINGNTATTTVPWDTCTWSGAKGWLSLPNASTVLESADFTVSSSITVDVTTPASPSTAPDPTPINGTTEPVPTVDVAPSIDVFGPELLRVSPKSRAIRLIVQSSAIGTLQAGLGAVKLGSRPLRAGNNDVRFIVPVSLIRALRGPAATRLLTLTPVSESGAASGVPVTRRVALARK